MIKLYGQKFKTRTRKGIKQVMPLYSNWRTSWLGYDGYLRCGIKELSEAFINLEGEQCNRFKSVTCSEDIVGLRTMMRMYTAQRNAI